MIITFDCQRGAGERLLFNGHRHNKGDGNGLTSNNNNCRYLIFTVREINP